MYSYDQCNDYASKHNYHQGFQEGNEQLASWQSVGLTCGGQYKEVIGTQ